MLDCPGARSGRDRRDDLATAFATQQGSPAPRALIAVQALASLAGGLWYGSRHRGPAGAPLRHRVRRSPSAPCRSCRLDLASMFALMAFSGFAFAPASAAVFSLIDASRRGERDRGVRG